MFDVQILGGLVLNSSKIAEMKTGEGKTIVSIKLFTKSRGTRSNSKWLFS